jgi:hypothetical protein
VVLGEASAGEGEGGLGRGTGNAAGSQVRRRLVEGLASLRIIMGFEFD